VTPSYTAAVPAARLTVIDLFAGAGGLSEGFARNSHFRTKAAVEHNPLAAATFKANHPAVDVFAGDIADWLRDGVPSADVVVGGPPCQGFSNLGARQVRDPRNALWRRYVDALTAVEPLFFVLENVADFLRSGQFRDLYRETYKGGRLRNYQITPVILNAAEFGVPQIRRRAVVFGSRRDLPKIDEPVGELANRPDSWLTVRSAIGDLDSDLNEIDLPGTRTEQDGLVLPGPFKTIELHLGRRPTQLSLDRYAAIPAGGNRTNIPRHLLAKCWRDHANGSGDVMGRLHWDKPSVTIRTEFWKPEKGRYLHPEADRPITHLEAARIQGFPDDYLWYGSKSEIGRQMGNAVPIALAEGIATHVADQLA
jgi:DNA (cytosine-5)-methyltransferase 1